MKSALVLFSLFVTSAWAAPLEIAPHVVNGQALTVQHAAAVFAVVNEAGEGFFGGGSIISARHIITAASLLFGASSCRVIFGVTTLSQGIPITATTMTLHPLFNRTSLDNDIGIIFLPFADSIPEWTDAVRPIALPASAAPAIAPEGSLGGYGFTASNAGAFSDTLLVASLVGTELDTCTSRFPNVPFTTHFCAIGRANSAMPSLISNICSGDNGGGYYTGDGMITTTTTTTTTEAPEEPPVEPPEGEEILQSEEVLEDTEEADVDDESATLEDQVEPRLIGVASVIGDFWQCNPDDPRGYTAVFPYNEWIQDLTGVVIPPA